MLMNIPTRETGPADIAGWTIAQLAPFIRETCGPHALQTLIDGTDPAPMIRLKLTNFAKTTGGRILDPEHLTFVDVRVREVLRNTVILVDGRIRARITG